MSSKPPVSRGDLFVISAPSGAGKTSLVKALVQGLPRLAFSVSHTTRAPRPGERDGSDYHFVDPVAFEALVAQGAFLEHARVFDHSYGTTRQAADRLLSQGRDVILEIDWQGAAQVRRAVDCVSIFILPPSRAELQRRLRARRQDEEAVIARRLRDAVADMRHCEEFDYLVINDDFDTALAELRAIVVARHARRERQWVANAELLAGLLG